MNLITKSNTNFPITDDFVIDLQRSYQAVDVYAELDKMRLWLEANPAKRKTERGMKRFINSWLTRADDRAKKGLPLFGEAGYTPTRKSSDNPKGMDNLTDVSWLEGDEKESAKARYLETYGRYWDGQAFDRQGAIA